MKLSVGLITFNEEKILGKTLEAVKEIADEIIIVDSFSTDRTKEIALSYGVKFYEEKWRGFGPQKNSAIEKCRGEWTLLIDADEVLSEKLIKKIDEIKKGEYTHDVYKINRCCVCFGRNIRYGGWSNEYTTRLWKRGLVSVNDNLVHEEYVTASKIGRLKEKIYHHTYSDLQKYFEKINRYTTLGAQEYYKRGKKSGIIQIFLNPLYKFIRMYFIRLGFLDGIEGFVLASSNSISSMAKYFKLREIYRNGSYKD